MNAKAYYWIGVGSAFAIGVITGVAGVRTELEIKLRKEWAEREAMMQAAYEKALEMGLAERETPEEEPLTQSEFDEIQQGLKEMEAHLEEIETDIGPGILTEGGKIEEVKGQAVDNSFTNEGNPYHRALAASETSIEAFVEGGVNEYGVAYIEEEDYQDDDGRYKGKIDILITEDQDPVFMQDGQPIDDWAEKVGESILVDFYKLVPPGVDPILYVRNHRTDEDYEVVRVVP